LAIAVTVIFAFQHPGGLFLGSPLEAVATKRYAELFQQCGSQKLKTGKPKKQISSVIFNCDTRWRDLVITASSLTSGSRGSKYFYLPGAGRRHANAFPSYGTQGVEIGIGKDCDPKYLVDIALGSGTIFPIFPYHKLQAGEPNNKIKTMDLIDGGFAHNTPIEAAVRWGATHIILIGPSPEAVQEGTMHAPAIENFNTAFNYLYDQAQVADVNAQEEAAVFPLRPRESSKFRLGLLDFAPGFAGSALQTGSDDAAGFCFVRQPTRPLFWDVQTPK
jgi:hypothetical protein